MAVVMLNLFGQGSVTRSGARFPADGSNGKTPAFEVASIRIVPESKRGYTSISPPGAAMFTARNVTLAVLIGMAFGVDASQISGKQLGSEEYDVTAKPQGDAGLTYEQLKPPLQQLLQERFHLTSHHETKTSQGYALVIAKGGPKLHASTGGSAQPYIFPGGLRGEDIPMPVLAALLARPLRCPVVDNTKLKGNYDIKLDYAPDEVTDSPLPSIFTAVQEDLGLKLERQKVPVEMLVIDHVEKTPTEN
jgi:uncharacterized protein (TIGR03435 family)